jgi:hypothetical protein
MAELRLNASEQSDMMISQLADVEAGVHRWAVLSPRPQLVAEPAHITLREDIGWLTRLPGHKEPMDVETAATFHVSDYWMEGGDFLHLSYSWLFSRSSRMTMLYPART